MEEPERGELEEMELEKLDWFWWLWPVSTETFQKISFFVFFGAPARENQLFKIPAWIGFIGSALSVRIGSGGSVLGLVIV